ncbi:hypothetical protein MMAD_32100 [Mycolicibacterium madagascariense]|uniref:NAD-dependent epimerase/dehydratase domain-containing protein n=1 Tax=Mycolicibacterium madagascariense TaxID=212765 RepID=A0A7I7XIK3_9MYCO|nr:NAD-dependent epimerase/dehydratase family protein [Mycolicibacterium madagascariense]MCV7010924.1 NAD(P)H-binding protein [Mycolicibacterium madagascariense]BBZ28915.1 hypothetical protein MMAD_32100 [Mycolicibacterium madagascariense]
MRIILTGGSGFVGSQVLHQLIDHPAVTGITALARRPLGVAADKLDVMYVDDFTHHDHDRAARLSEHDACIWTLGGKDSDHADPALYERITHGFTLALAAPVAAAATRPFTFCYLSGMGASQREDAHLPWERLTRNLKGRTEKDLLALAEEHDDFHVHCFRPGGILTVDVGGLTHRLTAPIAVRVDDLATALIAVATGLGAGDVVTNSEIKKIARPTTADL